MFENKGKKFFFSFQVACGSCAMRLACVRTFSFKLRGGTSKRFPVWKEKQKLSLKKLAKPSKFTSRKISYFFFRKFAFISLLALTFHSSVASLSFFTRRIRRNVETFIASSPRTEIKPKPNKINKFILNSLDLLRRRHRSGDAFRIASGVN